MKSTTSSSARPPNDIIKLLIAGIIGMVIAMGIGRFVFTPILPLMQRDLALTNTLAGWLAGLNYLGYLAGAVICAVRPQILNYRIVAGISLILSIATTVGMGITVSPFWWGGMRLVGGVASALLFIAISAEVGESLTRRGFGHWVGSLYGGVGLGVAISGIVVPIFDSWGQSTSFGGWSVSWIGVGVLAAILAVIGIQLGRKTQSDRPIRSAVTAEGGRGLKALWALAVAYFLEGLGYVVTATFLVAIIAATPGLSNYAQYSWVAVGLAAVPSTIIWPWIARRIGFRWALIAAYAVQMSGIIVSVYADSVFEVMFAAVTFGGTFLGIVALALAEGNNRLPDNGSQAAAVLTAFFGIGQALGPIAAGILADIQEGFALPLFLAAGCIFLGILFILFDPCYNSKERS